jgi:3-oxoacyl-[acyl-carrier protein] reductase
MDLDLRDKVFLVTGATAGLGLATVGILLAEGARVVISSRTRHAVDKAATRLGRPDRTVGIAADIADPDTADRLVTAALTRFGRLDGVLVSVGGPPTGPLTTITDQQWRSSFESVFLGALRLARTAAPVLTATGSIGFVLSLSVRLTGQSKIILWITGDARSGVSGRLRGVRVRGGGAVPRGGGRWRRRLRDCGAAGRSGR